MSKKSIFLYIITFILAVDLAFLTSHFIIQEVRGVGIGNDIDMNSYAIIDIGAAGVAKDAVPFSDFKKWGEIILPQKEGDTCFPPSNVHSITTWCDINDFSFCYQDDFPPWDDDPPECFTARTPILMADGKYKNIANIQVGDYVLTRESENSSKLVKAKVLDVYEHWVNRYLIINDSLEVTYYHRMFVNGEWKTAGEIKLEDKLLNKDNQEVKVESIEKIMKEEKFRVYNLEIEKYQTYFAWGVYVHNKKPDPED